MLKEKKLFLDSNWRSHHYYNFCDHISELGFNGFKKHPLPYPTFMIWHGRGYSLYPLMLYVKHREQPWLIKLFLCLHIHYFILEILLFVVMSKIGNLRYLLPFPHAFIMHRLLLLGTVLLLFTICLTLSCTYSYVKHLIKYKITELGHKGKSDW